ncbi:MAG: MOSC domain-containing protein [Roseobacter sp.]
MADLSIVRLNRYPVKGLSAEPLEAVDLNTGEGIPGDRLFGFARYNSGFDPARPEPLPKERFVVLVKEAALAGLQTRFDADSGNLEIEASGRTHRFYTQNPEGAKSAATFLHRVLSLTDPKPPLFVSSKPHRFTDVSVVSPQMMNAISVVNSASIRDFGTRVRREIHPARFRANVEIDGLPPYAELDAMGATLAFGDVVLRILSRTRRCAATEVNPETAERDLKVPYLLRKEFGHMDMGVYVEVTSSGTLKTGQKGQMIG